MNGPTARPTTCAPSLERSARRWLAVAYPPRWRRTRGEELLGVTLDLTPPGASRLPLATGIDLVRGGTVARWRDRPTPGRWLAYRLLDVRVPPRYRAWVRDDIEGVLWPVRTWLPAMALPLLVMGLLVRPVDVGVVRDVLAVLAVGALLTTLLSPGWRRRRSLHRHLVTRDGEMPGAVHGVEVRAPRRRLGLGSAGPWLLGGAVVVTGASAWAAAVAPLGWWMTSPAIGPGVGVTVEQGWGPATDRTLIVVAVALAAVLAVVSGVRSRTPLRRHVRAVVDGTAAAQPSRALVPMTARRRVSALVWTTIALAVVVLEGVGRVPIGASLVGLVVGLPLTVVVGTALLLARPLATTAAPHAAAADEARAAEPVLVDALRLGFSRPVRVDEPEREVRLHDVPLGRTVPAR